MRFIDRAFDRQDIADLDLQPRQVLPAHVVAPKFCMIRISSQCHQYKYIDGSKSDKYGSACD